MRGEKIVGRVATGVGFGKHFTRLEWARRQFTAKLGIDPFPGTVNIIVEETPALATWNRLQASPGIRIDNPNNGTHDCDARCYMVLIEGRLKGAIVLPEVDGYASNQIEVITATPVRETLGVRDGDTLMIELA